MQVLSILGSTGSIGTQTLEIVRRNPEKFRIHSLTANKNWNLLLSQIKEFNPDYVVVSDLDAFIELKRYYTQGKTQILHGDHYYQELVSSLEVETVVNALVGAVGFIPTYVALKNAKKVALANKESLVIGGAIIKTLLEETNGQLLPVDSEHSAIFQCLVGESQKEIEKLILTASGGPFRDLPLNEFKNITVEQALKHPNWSMGNKITIDSATMMNKGLELIEAQWLFDVEPNKIDAVIHPQSIIHSMVTFKDGSTKAQLGPPDMMLPIQYALTYPERWNAEFPRMDWTKMHQLELRPIDYQRYPCLKLAKEAMQEGNYAPAIMNAANEIAVERFLNREIPYILISVVVQKCLEKVQSTQEMSVQQLLEVDEEARRVARTV